MTPCEHCDGEGFLIELRWRGQTADSGGWYDVKWSCRHCDGRGFTDDDDTETSEDGAA